MKTQPYVPIQYYIILYVFPAHKHHGPAGPASGRHVAGLAERARDAADGRRLPQLHGPDRLHEVLVARASEGRPSARAEADDEARASPPVKRNPAEPLASIKKCSSTKLR